MRGTLHKTEQGWQVSHATYDAASKHWTAGKLPLHPKDRDSEAVRWAENGSLDDKEVEFEIVTEWENGEVGVNGLTYAKLIEPKTGSKIDLQKLEAKLDKILAEETPESFHKWLESKTGPIRNYHSPKVDGILKEIEQDDVYEMAQEYAIESGSVNRESRRKGFVDGYNRAKSTLYTEEQVRDTVLKFAEDCTFLRQGIAIQWVKDHFKSIKQPKQQTHDMNKEQAKDRLIEILENQVVDLTVMSKIELGDDVIAEIKRLKAIINE